jgi:hypothetical protein
MHLGFTDVAILTPGIPSRQGSDVETQARGALGRSQVFRIGGRPIPPSPRALKCKPIVDDSRKYGEARPNRCHLRDVFTELRQWKCDVWPGRTVTL